MMRLLLPLLAASMLLVGCEEELTVPGQCPELCPGGQPVVRDTIVLAIEESDSSFFGYTGRGSVTSLLVSNGLAAGEARAWVEFPVRPDSIQMSDSTRVYTTDSVRITFSMTGRDTTVDDLKVYLHRVPRTLDSSSTFADIDQHLVAGTLIDSIIVPDSVRSGSISRLITDSASLANLIPAADSGRLALGLRLVAEAPTGVRLSAILGSGGASFITYGRVAVADTSRRRQTISLSAADNGFALQGQEAPSDPDLLYVGRVPSARTILRFPIPEFFDDPSVVLVRATLELTPSLPIVGLKGDAAVVDVRGVSKDIGAKSSPVLTISGSATLPVDSSELFGIDVLNLVRFWRLSEDPLPPVFLLAMVPDGGSFHRPVFRSTRSADGKPRLRITYLRPTPVEQP